MNTKSSGKDAGPQGSNHVADAARRAASGERRAIADPEPSLARRLGQIGVLGWTIVLPALVGTFAGRGLDRLFGTRVFFTAPLLMIGAACGCWFAWKWIHRQQGGPHA